MTRDEFNQKYLPYTKPGFEKYGPLEFDVPAATEFLDDLFKDLIKIPGFQVAQIKVKFNWCCFYSNLESATLRGFIEKTLKDLVI